MRSINIPKLPDVLSVCCCRLCVGKGVILSAEMECGGAQCTGEGRRLTSDASFSVEKLQVSGAPVDRKNHLQKNNSIALARIIDFPNFFQP